MYRHAHSWLDGPSEPGPTPEDCRELTNKNITGKKHLELKEVTATKLAVEAIEKREQRDVFWAGGGGRHATLSPRDKILLPVRVFHQLDRELFRGVLRGQVCLSGESSLSPAVHGATRGPGHQYGRVTILLNPQLVITERPEVILATLIHHMAHAYFIVCCGYGPGQDQHDLKHGLPISTLFWTIKGRFLRNHRSFPGLFRCTDSLVGHSPASSFGQLGMEGQSYCSWHCNDYEDFQACFHYLHNTLRPHKVDSKKLDDEEGPFPVEKQFPRSQYFHLFRPGVNVLEPVPRSQWEMDHPANTLVEFHYQGKAIPLGLGYLRYYAKFRAHLSENGFPVVKVPKDVGTKAFQSIILFAKSGGYEPNWRPDTDRLNGPPKIDTGNGNVSETGPCVPAEDFRVYAAAQSVGFEELQQYALRRLYSQSLLKGSEPMDFVEEVYTGKEPGKDKLVACGKGWKPDADLREFMRAFLAANHPDRLRVEVEVDDYGCTIPVGRAGLEGWKTSTQQTNLGLLQGPKWRERLQKLRTGGGAFLEDLDKVEENLKQGVGIEPPPAFAARPGLVLPWNEPTPLLLKGHHRRPLGLGYGYAMTPRARMDHFTPPWTGSQNERWSADGRREWVGREYVPHVAAAERLGHYDPDGLTDLFARLPLN